MAPSYSVKNIDATKICVEELAGAQPLTYAARMRGDILAQNIAAVRKHLGLKQEKFAEMLQTSQANVSKWENGSEPSAAFVGSIAELAGVSVASFMSEQWRVPAKGGQIADRSDHAPTRTADAGETAAIIRLDLSLPMGLGATVDDYIEEEPVLFDLAYIRGFTKTPPHRLRIARGVGDSMWPTLQSYDEVWIDSTRRELNLSNRIWAVSINGGAAIKRLRPLKGGRILVISDNPGPGHENYEVGADEVLIGGLVIKYSRDL